MEQCVYRHDRHTALVVPIVVYVLPYVHGRGVATGTASCTSASNAAASVLVQSTSPDMKHVVISASREHLVVQSTAYYVACTLYAGIQCTSVRTASSTSATSCTYTLCSLA